MLAPTAKKSGTTLSKDKPGPPSEKLRVFISYSRADTAIVDELVSGLEFEGSFQVLVDHQNPPYLRRNCTYIAPSPPWPMAACV